MKRAIEFGRSVDRGLGHNPAFPFIYGLIPKDENYWSANHATSALLNLTSGIGVSVPAASTVQHFVRLDPDYFFKLLNIKYSVYTVNAVAPFYSWYVPPVFTPVLVVLPAVINFFNNSLALPVAPAPGDSYIALATAGGWNVNEIYTWNGAIWVATVPIAGDNTTLTARNASYTFDGTRWRVAAWGYEPGDYEKQYGTQFLRNLRVSVLAGTDANFLYGGNNTDWNSGRAEVSGLVPVQISSIQGYDYCPLNLRTSYLLPADSAIQFRFTNTHATLNLVVMAAIAGMKVRL